MHACVRVCVLVSMLSTGEWVQAVCLAMSFMYVYIHVFWPTTPSLILPLFASSSCSDNHHCEVEDVHLEEEVSPAEGSTDCLF